MKRVLPLSRSNINNNISASLQVSLPVSKQVAFYGLVDRQGCLVLIENPGFVTPMLKVDGSAVYVGHGNSAALDFGELSAWQRTSTLAPYFTLVPLEIPDIVANYKNRRKFSYTGNEQDITTTCPTECRLDDPRPVVFEGRCFWTRLHAYIFAELNYLANRGRKRHPTKELMRQLQVGSDETLKNPKSALDAATQQLSQFIYIAEQLGEETVQESRITLLTDILRATTEQYPELKVLLLQLWQHHSLVISGDNWELTEAWMRLVFEWQGYDFRPEWFAALVENIKQGFAKVHYKIGDDFKEKWQSMGVLNIDYHNLVPGSFFKQRPYQKGVHRKLQLEPGLVKHLQLLIQDVEESTADNAPPFLLSYFDSPYALDRYRLFIHFRRPATASVFRSRFINCFGLEDSRMTLEGVALACECQQASCDVARDYLFGVSMAMSAPDQLQDFLMMVETNPILFPLHGENYMKMLTREYAVRRGIAYSASSIYVVNDEFTQLRNSLQSATSALIVEDSAQAPRNALLAPFLKNTPKQYYPSINYKLSAEQSRILNALLAQYPAPGTEMALSMPPAERDMRDRLLCYAQQQLTGASKIASIQLANGKQSPQMPQYTDLRKMRVNAFSPMEVFDHHRDKSVTLFNDEMIKQAQCKLHISSWLHPEELGRSLLSGDVKRHYQAINSENIRETRANRFIAQRTVLATPVRHTLDVDSGVYYPALQKWQFILTGEDFTDEKVNCYTPTSRPMVTLFKKKENKLNPDLTEVIRRRYEVLFTEVKEKNIHYLALNLDASVVTHGKNHKAACDHQAEALAYVIQYGYGIDLILIAAPVVDDNDYLYQSLKYHLGFVGGLSGTPKLLVANVLPRAAITVLYRYLLEINPSVLNEGIAIAEVIPSQNVLTPGKNFQTGQDAGLTIEQSSVAASDRLFTQHPAFNPHFEQEECYRIISVGSNREIKRPGL